MSVADASGCPPALSRHLYTPFECCLPILAVLCSTQAVRDVTNTILLHRDLLHHTPGPAVVPLVVRRPATLCCWPPCVPEGMHARRSVPMCATAEALLLSRGFTPYSCTCRPPCSAARPQVRTLLPPAKQLMYHDRLWWDLSAPRAAIEQYCSQVGQSGWVGQPTAKAASPRAGGCCRACVERYGTNRAPPSPPPDAPNQVCADLGLGVTSLVSVVRAMKDAVDKAKQVQQGVWVRGRCVDELQTVDGRLGSAAPAAG